MVSRVEYGTGKPELFRSLRSGASMRLLFLLLALVVAASAASVVEFPKDFARVEVGDVVAYYAPNVTCPIIVVSPPLSDKYLTRLLNITTNFTDPRASYGIASILREAVREAGGVLYEVGVIGTSPPAGFVAAYGLNVTKFAELVRGIRVIAFVLPWRVRPLNVSVEVSMLKALEEEHAYKQLMLLVRRETLARAKALKSWILGNDTALGEEDVRRLKEKFINTRLEGEALRRSVKKSVERIIGKPVEDASEEELAAALPYTIGVPFPSVAAGVKDTFFGIPILNVHALPSANITTEAMREAGIRALSKVLNCTPSVLYIYAGPIGYFIYDVAFTPDSPESAAASPRSEPAATWPLAAVTAPVAIAAASAYFILRRR